MYLYFIVLHGIRADSNPSLILLMSLLVNSAARSTTHVDLLRVCSMLYFFFSFLIIQPCLLAVGVCMVDVSLAEVETMGFMMTL